VNALAVHRLAEAQDRPGRDCPTAYRYPPSSLDRAPDIEADTLFVAGGLYGNVQALEALLDLVAGEPGAALAFNGDFHWFDTDAADFERVDAAVERHARLRGNAETELAGEESGAGCGCAYPADVSDEDVEHSNEILERLRETARGFPGRRAALGRLPMNLVARVGEARVGIVHGDASSLAGWGFAHDRLDDPAHRRWIESAFAASRVDVFASSHTCLPALRGFVVDGRAVAVANNGATGMPNFRGSRHGIVTRVSVRPSSRPALYGLAAGGVHVEAIAVDYDAGTFRRRFLAQWPEGTPAHASYFRRIETGPAFARERAAPPPAP
jgi:hypothetical protein